MKYAVIAISGTQYRVEEGQTITVDKIDPSAKSINEVLLAVTDKKVDIGSPIIKNASIDFEIVKNYQGKKLDISKFRAKSRYRKTMGFRHQLTDIKITKINLS